MVFCAARQTTCGVAGMATSSWPTASVRALMTAGGEAIAPASPQPLMPSGLDGQRVSIVSTLERGQVVGARHAIVHEARRQELAVVVVMRAFEQRLTHALGDAAVNLALDDHRIDQLAEVVDRGPPVDRHDAGLRIDFELADVNARREGEVGRVPERALLEAGLKFLAVELVRDIGAEARPSRSRSTCRCP